MKKAEGPEYEINLFPSAGKREVRIITMDIFIAILLGMLLLNAVMVVCVRNLLSACVIFMIQSLVMVLLWMLLQAPDLAITEAAVGAGVSSLLFFLTLRRIRAIGPAEAPEKDASRIHPAPEKKGGSARG